MSLPRTVIIGGGAIGLSVAYHLGRRGAEGVVLLERNRLTSGTSWHAAGICGPLRSSYNLTVLAKYGVELFAALEAETGQATGYRQTGGMWLAQQSERMTELLRMKALGDMHGLSAEVISPEQARERFTYLNTDGLAGALWVNEDGQLNPVDLCMAYARGARSAGVEIREQSGVSALQRQDRRISTVILDDGERIEADRVINCAGLWAGIVGSLAGAAIPLAAVEHMYVVTEPVVDLPDPCPVMRDLDSGIYIKGDAGKLVLGQFEPNARLWDPARSEPASEFLEFPDDWDHAEPMLRAGIRRAPIFASLGISRFMNGPESFTPDTRQLMGRIPGFENFFVAAGFNSIGIMSSAGVGRVMADWMLDGCSPMDLWDVDIQRMLPGDGDSRFLRERIPEAVHNQFQMHWPCKQFRTGRNRKRSPWHRQLAQAGAVFGAPTGWERPLWFAAGSEEAVSRYSYGEQHWWPMAERESRQLSHGGALFELSPFSKFEIAGADSLGALQRLCSNAIDVEPGKVVYTLMLNAAGGIEAEATVTRIERDRWRIATGAATRIRDLDRLRRLLPASIDIHDATDEESVLGIMGPNARKLLQAVLDIPAQLDQLSFARAAPASINDIPLWLARISYVGEFGYELYVGASEACEVLARIAGELGEFGFGFAGQYCLDSCRLEKGYVHWGHDIGPDDDPVSAGLTFAVKPGAGFDFIGRDAVLDLQKRPPRTRRTLFEVYASRPLLLHDEPLYRNGELVGRTTSGGLGFRTGKALCMGYITAVPAPTDRWQIEIAGERVDIGPLARPPYDPAGTRMRA